MSLFAGRKSTMQGDRVPPGQSVTGGFPVLHYGDVPYYRDMSQWDLRIFGLVEEEVTISYEDFMALPRKRHGKSNVTILNDRDQPPRPMWGLSFW